VEHMLGAHEKEKRKKNSYFDRVNSAVGQLRLHRKPNLKANDALSFVAVDSKRLLDTVTDGAFRF